jgi:LPS export ABC transporter protein LptC
LKKKFILLLPVLLLFWVCGCGKSAKIQPKLPISGGIEDIPNFVMEGFKMKSTDKGKVRWEITARAAQIFELKKKAYAQSVIMVHYDEMDKKTFLYGDRAEINTDTNFMIITGNVKAVSSEGAIIQTQKLFWDDKLKKMYTDDEVTITRQGSVLKGIGFESDAGFKNVEIKRRVRLKAETASQDDTK